MAWGFTSPPPPAHAPCHPCPPLPPRAAAGSVAGKLAAGATSWVPASHVRSQQEGLARFFALNGYIAYDTARRQYGVPASPKPFLAAHFPDGLALDTAYVAPAVINQVGAAPRGGWGEMCGGVWSPFIESFFFDHGGRGVVYRPYVPL